MFRTGAAVRGVLERTLTNEKGSLVRLTHASGRWGGERIYHVLCTIFNAGVSVHPPLFVVKLLDHIQSLTFYGSNHGRQKKSSVDEKKEEKKEEKEEKRRKKKKAE